MREEFHIELDKLKSNIEADLIKSLTEHESVEEALSIDENKKSVLNCKKFMKN